MKTAKKLNNEAYAYKLFTSGKTLKQMRVAFKKRYPDATPAFLTKRVGIYYRIAERKVQAEKVVVNK